MSLIEKNAPGQQQPSFEELNRAAEEAAGVPSDEQMYGEFLPQQEVEAPEPEEAPEAPVEAPVAPEEPAEPEVHPDQETLPVEPEPEPESDPVAEMNKKLGQLINENAEMRRELASYTQPVEAQPQPVQPMTDVGWFDEMAETNPAAAATWALENGQSHLFDRAVRTWHEIDTVAAGRYERYVENQDLMRNINQTLAPQIAGAQELANRSQLEGAMNAVASRHDDYQDVMGTMTPDTIQNILGSGLPVKILEEGLQGDQTAKEQVFETLYRWQKAEVAGQLVQAARETPGKQTEEARQAKLDAFVGSASTSTPDEVPPPSEGERLSSVWAEDERSVRKGWVGQDSRRSGR